MGSDEQEPQGPMGGESDKHESGQTRQMTEDEKAAADLVDIMNEFGKEFEQLRTARHEHGQKEYGKFTFLENDIIRMMCEELADTANYCQYQYVKLRMLQDLLEEQLGAQGFFKEGQEAQINIGAAAFQGTGVGWQRDYNQRGGPE
jgi:hypothetical protein